MAHRSIPHAPSENRGRRARPLPDPSLPRCGSGIWRDLAGSNGSWDLPGSPRERRPTEALSLRVAGPTNPSIGRALPPLLPVSLVPALARATQGGERPEPRPEGRHRPLSATSEARSEPRRGLSGQRGSMDLLRDPDGTWLETPSGTAGARKVRDRSPKLRIVTDGGGSSECIPPSKPMRSRRTDPPIAPPARAGRAEPSSRVGPRRRGLRRAFEVVVRAAR